MNHRQIFTGRVLRLERKRYYKSVGLPYSELVVEVEGLGRAVLKYNRTFHALLLVPGDEIEFSVTTAEKLSGGLPVLLRPTNVRRLNR